MNQSHILRDKAILAKQIKKRRTFCIISHPNAGKTTVTEKFLLFGGAIQMAGTIKSRKSKKFATSDWMEIEKQRGISVTSSVLKFSYENHILNLLDTPGHQDFLEDTYRAITAVDSALMIIDCAKGLEAQTIKLWEVCRSRKIPVVAFINKLDRESKDSLELMEEIEKAFGVDCVALTWPIGQGKEFKGVYDRLSKQIRLFTPGKERLPQDMKIINLADTKTLIAELGKHHVDNLHDDLQLLDMAGTRFDIDDYLKAKQIPVMFGSAINNFGIQELLLTYLKIAPTPAYKETTTKRVLPDDEHFSGFIFKIQANMDKNHRDRIVFVRICSGVFQKGMKVYHCRLKREFKVTNPIIFNAQQRESFDDAYPGDIIGIVDTNNFQIGDSLTTGKNLDFVGMPHFSPEHFSMIKLNDSFKSKQLTKSLQQLSEEGAVQLFRSVYQARYFLGVVGRLQFEVIKFRLLNEYNVDCDFINLPYKIARWYKADTIDVKQEFEENYTNQIFKDRAERDIFLAKSKWELNYILDKYPTLKFFDNSDKLVA
ncbi:MAG: peptide chain release factor 3 [SAR324 cluster bacterium]|nr:peptide chain release factor 3 [SAR324 cluster bacterium]